MKILMIQMLVHGIATKNPNFCVPKTVLSLLHVWGVATMIFTISATFKLKAELPPLPKKRQASICIHASIQVCRTPAGQKHTAAYRIAMHRNWSLDKRDDSLYNDDNEDDDGSEVPCKQQSGRKKIKIEYIQDKNRRHITFSKRKAGIMKKVQRTLSTAAPAHKLATVSREQRFSWETFRFSLRHTNYRHWQAHRSCSWLYQKQV